MESERSLTPNSDRDHVQRERAAPFSYRSALHTLLGMSDAAGKQISYARMAPAARYSSPPFLESWQETEPSGFDDATAPDQARATGSPEASAPLHRPLEEHTAPLSLPLQAGPRDASARYTNMVMTYKGANPPGASIRYSPRQADTDAISRHDWGFSAAAAKVEQPHQTPEEITIAVPGISARPQRFPALVPEKHDDRLASTAEEGEGVAGGRGRQRDAASMQLAELGRLSAVEGTAASARHLMAESVEVVLGRLRDNAMCSAEEGEGVAGGRGRQRDAASMQLAELGRLSAVEGTAASARHLIAESAKMVLERLRTNTESSANGDIAASIEQLRHMVRELAARVALQQVRASDGPQPRQTGKTPPQAVQRVVIKQAAPQSRVPRAFWERRYLHRLSWRSLR